MRKEKEQYLIQSLISRRNKQNNKSFVMIIVSSTKSHKPSIFDRISSESQTKNQMFNLNIIDEEICMILILQQIKQQLIQMGSLCKNPSPPSGELPQLQQKPPLDPTLVLLDIQSMKSMINRKSGEIQIDITRSIRKSSNDAELSLILPACKDYGHTLIIKYYLIYSFHISQYEKNPEKKSIYQNLFFNLITDGLRQKQEQDLLSKFKQDHQNQRSEIKQHILLLNYSFKSKHILEKLNKVLLESIDPKALAYFIYPLHALHAAIKTNFSKAPYSKRREPLWIVAVLQDRQIEIIEKMMKAVENYFFFSVFIRGFTDQVCANQAFKNIRRETKKNTFLFTVNFPDRWSKLSQQQNKGFYIFPNADSEMKKRGDVLFNIMSSFRLNSKTSTFEYDIDYGQLASLKYLKDQQRLSGKEPKLLKIYELCRGISRHYLKSQSCLVRIIGGKQQSLKVSNIAIEGAKSGTDDLSTVNDIERENIINTHIQNGQYDKALKKASQSDSLLFKAKKIQILYQKGKMDEAKEEIEKISHSQLKNKKNIEARLIIVLITARIQMKNNQYKKAHKHLTQLNTDLQKQYNADYEYIARDVVSALVQCERKGDIPPSGLDQLIVKGAGGYNDIGGPTLSLGSISVKPK